MVLERFGAISTAKMNNFEAGAAPTANDDSGDGYGIGSVWIDTTNDVAWMCVDATVAAAVWLRLSPDSVAFAAVITNADSADATKARVVLPCPFAGEITKVEVKLNESETCGATSLIVDVHKITAPAADQTGTTMYTTQANRPTVTNTNYYVDAALPDVLTFAQGDFLAFYIDQVGTAITTATIAVRAKKI